MKRASLTSLAVSLSLLAIGGCATTPLPVTTAASRADASTTTGSTSDLGLASAKVETGSISVDRRLTDFDSGSRSPADNPRVPISVATVLPSDANTRGRSDGYGALLLRPGNTLNAAACRAFFQHHIVKTAPQVSKTNLSTQSPILYRPTYWLDTRKSLEIKTISSHGSELAQTCDALLQHYDYERAKYIAGYFGLDGMRGPILAAWTESAGGAVAFDLSGYRTDRDFAKIIGIWQSEISTDPSIWKIGSIRSAPWYFAVRDAFNDAGQAVEAAVRVWNVNQARANEQ